MKKAKFTPNVEEAITQFRTAFLDAQADFNKADKALREAHELFDAFVKHAVVGIGLGYNAKVEHVQAAADHGKKTDKVVVSRVVNAFTHNGVIVLRVNLGVVGGGQGSQFANLPLIAVTKVIETSDKGFQ